MQTWWLTISNYHIDNEIKDKYVGFVYVTINKVTGKSYIGQKHFDSNNSNWEEYLGSGKILKQSIEKYGEDKFYKVIIGFAVNDEELNNLEKLLIDVNNATKDRNFYNISEGGHGGNTFAGYSAEEFEQYCKSLCGENNPYYGKHHSDETKKKMMEKRKNRIYHPLSAEAKEKISKSQKERLKKYNPKKKKFKILYKNGNVEYYDSFTDMRKSLHIEKRDYYRWKRYDIPKYKKQSKLDTFESISEIYEDGVMTYKCK